MKAEELTIKVPLGMCAEAEKFFLAHGCHIKIHPTHREVTYPKGTIKQEQYFRASFTIRYLLTFPDGTITWEHYQRHLELSILYYILGK